MTLKARITDDMKTAMRAKDTARLSTIRMLLAAIKQREIDERIELTDADVLSVIEKMLKQRKDSIAQFEAGRREDLAAIERAEVGVLTAYMPAQLSEAEIDAEIAAAVTATGAAGMAGMGKVMAILKPKLAGRADMAARLSEGQSPADARLKTAPRGDRRSPRRRRAHHFHSALSSRPPLPIIDSVPCRVNRPAGPRRGPAATT